MITLDLRAADPKKPYGDVSYADPGYQADGKKRYPLDSEAHCRAAYSYISMPKNAAKYSSAHLSAIKGRIKAAGKRYGITFADAERSLEDGEYRRDLYVCVRDYDFEPRSTDDGRTLEGHVAVFRSVARIPDRNGDFDEEIHPGVFDRYLGERGFPVMQFDHGKDTRVGSVPIGKYEIFEPDGKGYFVRGRLLDNPVVEPVRQAIEAGAIRGMSWRMLVAPNGDRWTRKSSSDGRDKRDVIDADVPEAGPVVFPAYASTTVTVRDLITPDLLADLQEQAGITDFTGAPNARSTGRGENDVEPREGDTSSHTQRANALAYARRALL